MKILVLGGSGLVGNGMKSILRSDTRDTYIFSSSKECNLRNYNSTKTYFESIKPDKVVHLAAYVGGLFRNLKEKVNMFNINITINQNVLLACHETDVKVCICCLSTCIFPDKTNYPINETMLHNGSPHESNYSYAYAKRMLHIGCRVYNEEYPEGCKFICVIPTNIYGPHDNFNLEDGHVIPALIHKCYLAKKNDKDFVVFGSGSPLRQFIYSLDLAKMIQVILENPEPINSSIDNTVILSVDEKDEISIGNIAHMIACEFGWEERIIFDTKFSDGQYKKTADNNKWKSIYDSITMTNIEIGIKETVEWFITNYDNLRK
jgi:GDP-L-fucose synthase